MYMPTQVAYRTVVKVPMLPLKITCGFHVLTEFELGTPGRGVLPIPLPLLVMMES